MAAGCCTSATYLGFVEFKIAMGERWNLMNENLWKENDPADSQDCQQVRLNLVAGGGFEPPTFGL